MASCCRHPGLRGTTPLIAAAAPGGLARELTPLATAERELRFAVLSAIKAQEFERNMVSKFLHDMVGQNLTAFGLQLDLLRMDL